MIIYLLKEYIDWEGSHEIAAYRSLAEAENALAICEEYRKELSMIWDGNTAHWTDNHPLGLDVSTSADGYLITEVNLED